MTKRKISICLLIVMTFMMVSFGGGRFLHHYLIVDEIEPFTDTGRLLAAHRVMQVQNLFLLVCQQGLIAYNSQSRDDYERFEAFSKMFEEAQKTMVQKETLETLAQGEQFSRVLALKQSIYSHFQAAFTVQRLQSPEIPSLQKKALSDLIIEGFWEHREMVRMAVRPIESIPGYDLQRETIRLHQMESMVLEMVNHWLLFLFFDHYPSLSSCQSLFRAIQANWPSYSQMSLIQNQPDRAEAFSVLEGQLIHFQWLCSEVLESLESNERAGMISLVSMMHEAIRSMHRTMLLL